MARVIKIGDRVQAFLNAAISGEVVSMEWIGSNLTTVGGTTNSNQLVCSVKTKSGKIVKALVSDLFITDY